MSTLLRQGSLTPSEAVVVKAVLGMTFDDVVSELERLEKMPSFERDIVVTHCGTTVYAARKYWEGLLHARSVEFSGVVEFKRGKRR